MLSCYAPFEPCTVLEVLREVRLTLDLECGFFYCLTPACALFFHHSLPQRPKSAGLFLGSPHIVKLRNFYKESEGEIGVWNMNYRIKMRPRLWQHCLATLSAVIMSYVKFSLERVVLSLFNVIEVIFPKWTIAFVSPTAQTPTVHLPQAAPTPSVCWAQSRTIPQPAAAGKWNH